MTYRVVGDLISKAKIEKCGDGNYPVLSMTMHDGIVFQDERFKKQIASIDQSTYNIVRRNQLVVSFPIDEGVLAVQDITDTGIVSPAYKIWDIDQSKVIPKYLELFLRSSHSIQYYKAKLRGSTARRRSITDNDLLSMELPLLTKPEQQHVIEVLNKVGRLVDSRKKELEKLDDLIKARFVELFGEQEKNPLGWEECTIGECCTLKSGTSLPAEKENEGGSIPYIKVGDMNYPGNERYIKTSSRFVTVETAGKGLFEVGSIMFPKRGGAIGTNKKRMTVLPICADLNVMGVSSNGKHLPEYLLTYFDMIDMGSLSDGSSVPQINNKNIAPLKICIPPMELQREFAQFIAQVDKSKVA